MKNTKGDAANKNSHRAYNLTLAAVTSLVGFITIVITLAALFAGLWLDSRFGTRPVLTLILTLASLPVTLVTMFVVVRWTTSRMLLPRPDEDNTPTEEEDIG